MKLTSFVIFCFCLGGILKQSKAQFKDGTYVGNFIYNNVATRGVFNLYKSNSNEYTVILQLYSLTTKKDERLGTVRLIGSIERDGFLKFNNSVWTEIPTIRERRNGSLSIYQSSVQRDYLYIQQVQLKGGVSGTLEGIILKSPFTLTFDPILSDAFLKDVARKKATFEAGPVSFEKAENDDERCVALLKWASVYAREFPTGEKLSRGEVSKSDLLFFDTHFVPVFGKPYDQLKAGEAGRIYDKIMKCYENPMYGQEFTVWHREVLDRLKALDYKSGFNLIKDYHWNDSFFKNPYRDQLLQRLVVYRLLYTDYTNTMSSIRAGSTTSTLEQLAGYRKMLQKFEPLWPSDLEKANAVIVAGESEAAKRSLKNLVVTVARSDNSYQSLMVAGDFSQKYNAMLTMAGKEFSENIQLQVNNKITVILAELMLEERKAISKMRLVDDGIATGNKWWAEFVSRYVGFSSYESVNQTKEYFYKSRLRMLTLIKSELETKIGKASTRRELTRLRAEYLGTLPLQYELVNELSSEMDARGEYISKLEKERLEQAKKDAERRERLAEAKGPKIMTDGLKYEKIIRSIWKGDFDNVPYDRGSLEFSAMFNAYLAIYSEQNYCFKSLPANKIELTVSEEDGWTTSPTTIVTRRGWEIARWGGQTTANHWRQVGTGVFVKPEMFTAKRSVELATLGSFMAGGLEGMLQLFKTGNPVQTAMQKVADAVRLKREMGADMEALIGRNGCNSPGLKRFEQNLRLFALGDDPIRLEGL